MNPRGGKAEIPFNVILARMMTDDYYIGTSIDGFRRRPILPPEPVHVVREWFGWPDVDVPLPPRGTPFQRRLR